MEQAFELEGRGSDLAILVRGATATDCLAAAVSGFAASIADVGADADRRRVAVDLDAEDAAALLVDLMDEAILRLDGDGDLAVALHDADLADGHLTGQLEVVALADVTVHGDPPKAATWHDLRLEPTDEGWRGQVTLDL